MDWLESDHEEIVDFGYEENQLFADIICNAYTAEELERLENAAEWGFEQTDSGRPVGETW